MLSGNIRNLTTELDRKYLPSMSRKTINVFNLQNLLAKQVCLFFAEANYLLCRALPVVFFLSGLFWSEWSTDRYQHFFGIGRGYKGNSQMK